MDHVKLSRSAVNSLAHPTMNEVRTVLLTGNECDIRFTVSSGRVFHTLVHSNDCAEDDHYHHARHSYDILNHYMGFVALHMDMSKDYLSIQNPAWLARYWKRIAFCKVSVM